MYNNLCEFKNEDYENKKAEIFLKNFDCCLDAKILVAQLSSASASNIVGYLEKIGFTDVYGTTNGLNALEQITKNNVDLVLSYQYLDELSGFDLVKKLRETRKFRNLPIIAATADAMKGDREAYLKKGFTDYLPIPTGTVELETIVKKNLDSYVSKKIDYKFKKILFIGDSFRTKRAIDKLYAADFINTAICKTYDEASDYLKDNPVKLIIMDLGLENKSMIIPAIRTFNTNANIITTYLGSANDLSELKNFSEDALHRMMFKGPFHNLMKLVNTYVKK